MPRLFLIDHSVASVGGHYFESATLLAAAALRRGFKPFLAANRRFRAQQWPVACPVLSLFPRGIYLHPSPPLPAWAAWLSRPLVWWWDQREQRRHIAGFSAACRRLFEQFPIAAGDIVFLPTITDIDFVGLIEFLSACPAAHRARWCLQFHYPLVPGTWTGTAAQHKHLGNLRRQFQALTARVPGISWHFLAPTQPLVDQYRQLGIAPVTLAPHPVDVPLAPTRVPAEVTGQRPLRVLCAGGFRREKGRNTLAVLLDELVRDDFSQGRLQLWVQARRPEVLRRESGGRQWTPANPGDPAPAADARLVHVPHPLEKPAYLRLLQEADIVLLAYDRGAYATRCSGVLVECLACGVPVIVPADTWMAAELQATAGRAPQVAGLPGCAASGTADFARCLRALEANLARYRARAAEIAPAYAASHTADRIIALVTAADFDVAQAAHSADAARGDSR